MEQADGVKRCIHCGKDRTHRGMKLTGRFCSPTCLTAWRETTTEQQSPLTRALDYLLTREESD